MNVNLQDAQPTRGKAPFPRLQRLIDHSAAVVGSGETSLTGVTVLVSTNLPGVYRVWFETENDTWVWITEEGMQVEVPCPLSGHTHG